MNCQFKITKTLKFVVIILIIIIMNQTYKNLIEMIMKRKLIEMMKNHKINKILKKRKKLNKEVSFGSILV